ncbi:hypothetical protein DFH09DRAFT_1099497 [Mycena vulgaris]|nr:hypothetical protein DFH09DRAFT_1099497 [Mycena vulgaris]
MIPETCGAACRVSPRARYSTVMKLDTRVKRTIKSACEWTWRNNQPRHRWNNRQSLWDQRNARTWVLNPARIRLRHECLYSWRQRFYDVRIRKGEPFQGGKPAGVGQCSVERFPRLIPTKYMQCHGNGDQVVGSGQTRQNIEQAGNINSHEGQFSESDGVEKDPAVKPDMSNRADVDGPTGAHLPVGLLFEGLQSLADRLHIYCDGTPIIPIDYTSIEFQRLEDWKHTKSEE